MTIVRLRSEESYALNLAIYIEAAIDAMKKGRDLLTRKGYPEGNIAEWTKERIKHINISITELGVCSPGAAWVFRNRPML
jgi:hypothetical protein